MTIYIAPIGDNTDHVLSWLAEASGRVHILWLIHSKPGKKDFLKIAKKLSADLKPAYPRLKIKLKTIDNPFEIDSTMDAIHEIILKEEDVKEPPSRSDFTLNITGGTKAIAAATMLAATWYGTKADYVLEPQPDDPQDKQYVVHLPIKPMGVARTNHSYMALLKMINDSEYYIDTPKGIDHQITKGKTTRVELIGNIEKIKETKMTSSKKILNKRSIENIVPILENEGLIEIFNSVEHYVYKDKTGKQHIIDENTKIQKKNKTILIKIENKNEVEWIEWKNIDKDTKKVIGYQITSSGKRIVKDAILSDVLKS
jgi:hypothetical protein